MKKNHSKENEEVLYSKNNLTIVEKSDIKELKLFSGFNQRKRIRLCTHPNQTDLLHEMIIVHKKNAYVRPHKHISKSESTHIIEGVVDVVLFDKDGKITEVIEMGDYASGNAFYYRITNSVFHTLIIRSDHLVFHETTNGPFHKNTTIFAPWAPEDSDEISVINFMADLENKLKLKI